MLQHVPSTSKNAYLRRAEIIEYASSTHEGSEGKFHSSCISFATTLFSSVKQTIHPELPSSPYAPVHVALLQVPRNHWIWLRGDQLAGI